MLFVIIISFSLTCAAERISYGGILNYTQKIDCKSSELHYPIRFAMSFAKKRSPHTLPLSNTGKIRSNYKAYKCTVLELIYTEDDQTPAYNMDWGFIYRFQVKWPNFDLVHSFSVTDYMDNMYVFAHSYINSKETISNQVQVKSECDSDVESVLYKSTCQAEDTIAPVCKMRHYLYEEDETCQHSLKLTEDKEFRLLTYNIWNTNVWDKDSPNAKIYKDRLQRIAHLVNSSDADMVGFQEVRFQHGHGGSLGPNQVQHLASLLPQYQFVFEPAQIHINNFPNRIEEGVAVFSKFPITAHRSILLPRNRKDPADQHQRNLLDVTVSVPVIGEVRILNTHLALSHTARQTSVRRIWAHIKKQTAPVILVGDFNAEAHNEEIKFLNGELSLRDVETSGLRDLWRVHHPGDPGFTFSTLHNDLSKRIDFIFQKDHDSVICSAVDLMDDGNRKKHAASDHLGVLATFRVKKQQDKK